MGIDLRNETPLTLRDVRGHPLFRRNGKPLAPSTTWRWTSKGCPAADGTLVRLESYRAGGRTMTTVEAVERFVRELTERSNPPMPDIAETERQLREQRLIR